MALAYVTVTGTFDDGSGTALAGNAVFTPSETVYAAGVPVVSASNPVQAQIIAGLLKNASGGPLQLLATDNAGLTFEGLTGFFYWTVSVTLAGVTQPGWAFFLPSSPSTVDLYALANTVAGGGGGGATLPLTTLGDTLYEDATPTPVRLPGNTAAAKRFLTQTGTGSTSAPPAWGAIAAADISAAYPYQFYVKNYGATGDGKIVTDGAMSSSASQTHLACATSTPFANATAGMPVHVGGAGGGTYTPLCTTIATVTDTGHVVLNTAATSTVSSAIVYFGTDDTAAIQAAVNAAVTYAQANHGYAEVLFDPLTYIIGGAPVIGGGTLGNAQITLPVLADTAQKVTLVFRGTLDQSALPHWLQTTPQAAGTVLACARNDGTVDATFGPSCVIGGPFDGYGAQSPGENVWDNMCPVIDGITVMVPYNGTYGGFDFYGMAEANVPNGACMAAAVVPGSSSVPSMGTPSNIGNFGWFGLRMPSWRNNANCNIGLFSAEGLVNGLRPSEHTVWDSVRLINCFNGLVPYVGAGSTMDHYIYGGYACIENCSNGIVSFGSPDGSSRLYIGMVDVEVLSTLVTDSGNNLIGYIGACGVAPSLPTINGAANLRIINLQQASGPVASPASPPSSGSPWANPYYRDAWITLKMSAGSITALLIDSTAQNITAGAVEQFLLPSGHSYTPTYSGGTLSHSVTLL